MKEDTTQRRMQFQNHQMLEYFYRFAKKLIPEENDQVMESFCQLNGRGLWEYFDAKYQSFKTECEQIDEQFAQIQKKVQELNENEGRQPDTLRRKSYLRIRRIPKYSYFSLWKNHGENAYIMENS